MYGGSRSYQTVSDDLMWVLGCGSKYVEIAMTGLIINIIGVRTLPINILLLVNYLSTSILTDTYYDTCEIGVQQLCVQTEQ